MQSQATEILYGKFPRGVGCSVGNGGLRQFYVHSPGEFEVFLDKNDGQRTPYASISWRPVGGDIHLDKVSLDLDTPLKGAWEDAPVDSEAGDDVKIAEMRADPELADEVLKPTIEDAKAIARYAGEEGIPVIGVFSGFGLHVHLLYRETTEDLKRKYATTARKFAVELELNTVDEQVSGDQKRVLKIPDTERVFHGEHGSRGTDCYAIPLSRDELETITARKLMKHSRKPRHGRVFEVPDDENRPTMEVHDNYARKLTDDEIPETQREVDATVLGGDNDVLQFFLQEWLSMPCMYERITQSDPHRFVRFNCAILLFNVGFDPHQVANIYSRIGWPDFDMDITMKQLRNIYRNGYSDASCAKIRKKGFCVLDEDEWQDCSCYGWSNGKAEWK